VTGRGQIRVEKQAMESNNPHEGHRYMCDGNMVQCLGEECEPWDGRDQNIVCMWLSPFLKLV
jgi:hypothetical protein